MLTDSESPVLGRITKGMSFSQALFDLKQGLKIARLGWNGKGMWIELQKPDENSKMTRPYIFMSLPLGSTSQFGNTAKELDRVPWLPSQTDLLSEDWHLID